MRLKSWVRIRSMVRVNMLKNYRWIALERRRSLKKKLFGIKWIHWRIECTFIRDKFFLWYHFQTQAISGLPVFPTESPLYSRGDLVHIPDCDGRKHSNCDLCETVKQVVLTSMGLLLGVSLHRWQKIGLRMSSSWISQPDYNLTTTEKTL